MGAGWLLAGQAGMLMALAAAAAINLYAWWNSGKAVLRYYRAREIDAHSHPGYYALVERLARQAGLPMPRVRSEEHTSELQSLMRISYAVFCLKKKKSTAEQRT